MKLLFRQRMFSWFDSYDVFYESGAVAYTVEGKFGWGHKLHILDGSGRHIATMQERVFRFFPTFELYIGEEYVGCIRKELSLFRPRYTVECAGWTVDGDFFEWDYRIVAPDGTTVTKVSKELFRFTDTYTIDVGQPQSELLSLLVVLAIDAEKCSRN